MGDKTSYITGRKCCFRSCFMKIEKRKVFNGVKLSNATKTAIAATFGMAAAAAISGCNDDSDSIVGPAQGPTPVSSNASESSSSVQDIPLSHEAISSSVLEALSSATQPLPASSSAANPVSSAAEPTSSATEPASSAVEPASSATEPTSSAAEPGSSANETTSSSSIETPASSSSAQSPYGDCAPDDNDCINEWLCTHDDPRCPTIHFCEDRNDPRCMVVSMVSTYDRSDIS